MTNEAETLNPEDGGNKAASGNRRFLQTRGLLETAGLSPRGTDLIRKFVAEFLALAFFSFIGSLCLQKGDLNIAAMAHGLTIALLIIGIGHVSGGHLNPAVTVGLMITQKTPVLEGLMYILAQLLGSILGGALVLGSIDKASYYGIAGGALSLGAKETTFAAIVGETVITANLVYIVLVAAVDQKNQVIAALAIGFSVAVGIFALGTNTGASMNPARSFGPLLVYTMQYDSDYNPPGKHLGVINNVDVYGPRAYKVPNDLWADTFWIHLLGPLLGAVFAAVVYRLFFYGRNQTEEE